MRSSKTPILLALLAFEASSTSAFALNLKRDWPSQWWGPSQGPPAPAYGSWPPNSPPLPIVVACSPVPTTATATITTISTATIITTATVTVTPAALPPIVATTTATVTVTPAALPPIAATKPPPFCLDDTQAQIVANDFAVLLVNYTTDFALAVLASDYIDQADSVNTLINSGGNFPVPLGSLTFATKDAFIAGQGSQPSIPFQILNLWHTCDTVIIRWVSAQTPLPVQGFDALVVTPSQNASAPGLYQISQVLGEFNSGAWLRNLGNPECNATAVPPA